MSRRAGQAPRARLASGVSATQMLLGLDTSHFQNVNWSTLVRDYHLQMGHAKAAQGTTERDPDFAASMAQMAAVNLPIRNGYLYFDATKSAATQADIITDLCLTHGANMVTLDLEQSGGDSASQLNGAAAEFGHELRARSGLTRTLYAGGYAHNSTGRNLCAPGGPFDRWWYPRYPGLGSWPSTYNPRLDTITVGKSRPDIWQWTDNFHGMDADVSPLTVDELLGGDVPLTDADIAKIWAAPLPSKRKDAAGKVTGTEIPAGAYLTSIDVNAANALAVNNAVNAAIAGITKALIDALPAALAQAVVQVDVNVNGKATS